MATAATTDKPRSARGPETQKNFSTYQNFFRWISAPRSTFETPFKPDTLSP